MNKGVGVSDQRQKHDCWWAHWGWPKPIADIFLQAKEKLGGDPMPLLIGPSWITWNRRMFELDYFALQGVVSCPTRRKVTKDQLAVIKWSLEELCKLDGRMKRRPVESYGKNAKDYPPPDDWERVPEPVAQIAVDVRGDPVKTNDDSTLC